MEQHILFSRIHNSEKERGLFSADSDILTESRRVWWGDDTTTSTSQKLQLDFHPMKENLIRWRGDFNAGIEKTHDTTIPTSK